MNYCADPYSYQRRVSREVRVGNVGVGGDNPIRVQSMITCDTMDTAASIAQTIELAEAGCEIVRITAPSLRDAEALREIHAGLRRRGVLSQEYDAKGHICDLRQVFDSWRYPRQVQSLGADEAAPSNSLKS